MQPEQAQTSDSDLLRAVARDDQAALAAIYDRYWLILFGIIVRILHDREEAEDVLQEVFLQVWRRAADFDEARGRAFTWLVTMARSRALDRLRASGSRQRAATGAAEMTAVAGDAREEAGGKASQVRKGGLPSLVCFDSPPTGEILYQCG